MFSQLEHEKKAYTELVRKTRNQKFRLSSYTKACFLAAYDMMPDGRSITAPDPWALTEIWLRIEKHQIAKLRYRDGKYVSDLTTEPIDRDMMKRLLEEKDDNKIKMKPFDQVLKIILETEFGPKITDEMLDRYLEEFQ